MYYTELKENKSPKEIGRLIKATRKALGWSQTELSKRCKLPNATISRIEDGKRADPRLSTVMSIDAAFKEEAHKAKEQTTTHSSIPATEVYLRQILDEMRCIHEVLKEIIDKT